MSPFRRIMLLGLGFAATFLSGPRVFSQTPSIYLRILVVKEPATARQVADRLAQGTPFAWLASEYSTDRTKKQGGFMGQVTIEELKEQIRTRVRHLKIGEVTGPIPVPEGLAFFQRTTMAHYTTAIRLMRSETYQEALEYLDKDLVLNPDRVHSLELKAYALQQLGRVPETKAMYQEILRQDPGNVLAHNNLGALLDEEGRPAEAAKLFERAVALDPLQDVALYNLAWLYASQLHDLSKALSYIQQAIMLKPDAAHYYAMLGGIYSQQGKPERARQAMAKAATLAPSASASAPPVPKSNPGSNAAISQPMTRTASIKVVTLPGGADASRLVTRLLQQNGFPVALRVDDPKPMRGIRIYHKLHAAETAHKIRNLIDANLPLRPLTWKSQFDIIVYVGP